MAISWLTRLYQCLFSKLIKWENRKSAGSVWFYLWTLPYASFTLNCMKKLKPVYEVNVWTMPCNRCNPNWNALSTRIIRRLFHFLDMHFKRVKAEQSCNITAFLIRYWLKYSKSRMFCVIFHSTLMNNIIYILKFRKIVTVVIKGTNCLKGDMSVRPCLIQL